MLLSIPIDMFNKYNVQIKEKDNNKIIPNCYFYQLLYSDSIFATTGIYLYFNLNSIKVLHYYDRYSGYVNNKYSISKNINNNTIIEKLINIERDILNRIKINKIKKYKIKKILTERYIRIFNNYNIDTHDSYYNKVSLILKMSGICETKDEIYINYKLIFNVMKY